MFTSMKTIGVGASAVPFAGRSGFTSDLVKRLKTFSSDLLPVYICGEEGSGRKHSAHFLHSITILTDGRFEVAHFNSFEENDIARTLFGHMESHLFKSDSVSAGALASAEHGTLVISNIEKMPLPIQVKLLGAIQLGCYQPCDGRQTVKTSARIVFTGTRTPDDMVAHGLMLPELFQILKPSTIFTLPLRERREDIEPLVNYFCGYFCSRFGVAKKGVERKAMRALEKLRWEGNVAELARWIAHAVVNVNDVELRTEHFPLIKMGGRADFTESQIDDVALEKMIDQKLELFMNRLGKFDTKDLYNIIISKAERPLIFQVLKRCRGNQIRASEMLGINRNTLRTKLKLYNIDARGIREES